MAHVLFLPDEQSWTAPPALSLPSSWRKKHKDFYNDDDDDDDSGD